MKKLLLLCLALTPAFSIFLDDLREENFHRELAYKKPFNAVGLLVSEQREGSGSIFGTATLIHPRVVLTAAHVLANTKNTTFYLIADGELKERKGKAICHPQFIGKELPNILFTEVPYDLAVFILDEEIQGMDLPALAETPPKTHIDYYTVGYGETNAPQPEEGGIDKFVITTVPDTYDRGLIGIPHANTYGAKHFGSVRQGDSGGPLLTKHRGEYVIHGVTSCILVEQDEHEEIEEIEDEDSPECNCQKQPFYSCYASVHLELPWILETIRDNL